MKSQGCGIGCHNDRKFHKHIGSSVVEIPARFQSDVIIITPNLVVRGFTRVGGKASVHLVNSGLDTRCGVMLSCMHISGGKVRFFPGK